MWQGEWKKKYAGMCTEFTISKVKKVFPRIHALQYVHYRTKGSLRKIKLIGSGKTLKKKL